MHLCEAITCIIVCMSCVHCIPSLLSCVIFLTENQAKRMSQVIVHALAQGFPTELLNNKPEAVSYYSQLQHDFLTYHYSHQ